MTTADPDVCTVVRGCWDIQSVLILHIPIMLTYTWTKYAHLYMYIQYVIMSSNSLYIRYQTCTLPACTPYVSGMNTVITTLYSTTVPVHQCMYVHVDLYMYST